jgi:phosphoglycerate dehydrogenase-like enzyme
MDRERLKLLPDKALVVNVGRGACIDQTALLEELKADRLRAALDVFEKEPIPEDSEIWNWPNLLITPHVSGDMMLPYTVQKIVDMFLEDFELYNEGKKPSRLVDLRKGY